MLEEEVPGPHVSETQIANRIAASKPGQRQAAAKPETGGDSPNPFYDVFRTYSEPGGIKDEMTSIAAANRGLAKLVVIGKSGQGQDIVALKVTKDARNVRDGERPAMLFSAVNHAREWIAAEVGRRMPTWWLEHADDPEIAELLSRTELWFLPIQNPDGYDYTFTCGIGFRSKANEMCGATLVTDPSDPRRGTYVYKTADGTTVAPDAAQPDPNKRKPTQRLWRKTLRNNLVPETIGDSQDGVDPNRNYPTAWGLDEEGASNSPNSSTYRGPFPLSETEDLAYDRLLRKITPEAVINYHSAAQLLLYPFGYITDVYADDDPWFKALTGTDGDAAVDPYISQRSSDLYITNGETTDHAYNKYGSMSWTPELDECETAAGGTFCSGGSGFTFPDDEGKVEAVFQKNLDFARNVAATTLDRDRPDRPRNATDDETQYQTKAAPDIEPNRFNVSYGRDQVLEATTRKVLGPVDFEVQATGTGGTRTITLRAAPWNGGERFGDLRGKYYQRVRARIPADFVQPGTAQSPRPLVADNVVNVRVIAGSQQQRFSYRVVSTRPAGNAKRVLVVAAEDYTGLAPNKTDYDTAPRYLDEHVATLTANGYTVETLDLDQPPAGPNGQPGSKLVNDLGVLSHFDAVLFYTGDDLVPQETGEGVTDSNYRRGGTPNGTGAFSLTGSTHLPNWGVRNAHMLRNYMNEGGKVLLSGRNLWVQQTNFARGAPSQGAPQQDCVGGTGLNSYSNYSWWQDPVYGFSYPPDQAGDDDRPHTAFFRELDMPNDWGQWWLGIGSRCEGVGTTALASTSVVPSSDGLLAGMTPFALDTSAGSGGTLEPTQDADDGREQPAAEDPDAAAADLGADRAAGVPPGAGRRGLHRRAERVRRGDHLDAGLRVDRLRPRADHRRGGARRGRAARDGASAAGDGRLHAADGDVAAARRRGDGQRRRPGRDRGRGRGRARRHQGGPPQRRRHAGGAEGLLPVPDALAARHVRRRPDEDPRGRRRGQGRQRHDVHADHHGRHGVGDGGGAAAHGRDDPLRQAGGRRDADLPAVRVLRQRRAARLRVAARRCGDRRCERVVLRPDRRRRRPRGELPRDGDQQRRRRGLHLGRGDGLHGRRRSPGPAGSGRAGGSAGPARHGAGVHGHVHEGEEEADRLRGHAERRRDLARHDVGPQDRDDARRSRAGAAGG